MATTNPYLCPLIERAEQFYERGMAYYNTGDLYNSLLFLSLSTSNYEQIISYIDTHPKTSRQTSTKSCVKQLLSKEQYQKIVEELYQYAGYLEKQIRKLTPAQGGSSPCKALEGEVIQFRAGSKECKDWFRTVIGLTRAKKEIENGFINPLLYPNLFPNLSKGILLYGPPGVGKTMLVRAAINELTRRDPCIKVKAFAPTGAQLKGKYVGETEAKIESLFRCASEFACKEEQKHNGKIRVISVIFLDEVESVAGDRSNDVTGTMTSSVNALLQSIDGVKSYSNISVIAATNYPWNLDTAFRRRFETEIFIDLPNQEDINKLLHLLTSTHVRKKTTLKQIFDACKDAEPSITDSAPTSGCTKKDQSLDIYAWKGKPFQSHIAMTDAVISRIAEQCHSKHFSGSDVAQLHNALVRRAGEQALNNGSFIPVTLDDSSIVYVSTISPDKKSSHIVWLNEEYLYSSVQVEKIQYQNYKLVAGKFKIPIFLSDVRFSDLYVNESKRYITFLYEIRLRIMQSPASNYAVPSELPFTKEQLYEMKEVDWIDKAQYFNALSESNFPGKADFISLFIEKSFLDTEKMSNWLMSTLYGWFTKENVKKYGTMETLLESADNIYIGSLNHWYRIDFERVDIKRFNNFLRSDSPYITDFPLYDPQVGIDLLQEYLQASTIGGVGEVIQPVKIIRTLSQQKSQGEKPCPENLEKGIRYMCWNLSDTLLEESYKEARSTHRKDDYQLLKEYSEDPNLVLTKIAKKSSK